MACGLVVGARSEANTDAKPSISERDGWGSAMRRSALCNDGGMLIAIVLIAVAVLVLGSIAPAPQSWIVIALAVVALLVAVGVQFGRLHM